MQGSILNQDLSVVSESCNFWSHYGTDSCDVVQNAVSVIETDCEVDFAPPLDYVEPQREEPPPPSSSSDAGSGM